MAAGVPASSIEIENLLNSAASDVLEGYVRVRIAQAIGLKTDQDHEPEEGEDWKP